ncbi:DUF3189 family protein [Carboxydothermus pertinax]|uniref:DUF3189 domain-containing protein n=1 Tax=Carboxydothermus pertinax TaxID=870242 RepID=A0A1L8CTP1_9THEO|nr:DUF3189 family protein [Carboxydothermus pertinax]GAV22300.1 hypothetical protein cpu_08100 [Carboxydothermus pertinax]
MKIIYHCYGGAHSSVVMAAIHLGHLPMERIPSSYEIMNMPLYEKQEGEEHGAFFYCGRDEFGNDVYVLGRRSLNLVVEPVLKYLATKFAEKILVVNAVTYVNLPMKIGGFLSRRLKLIFLGRPLVLWGTRKTYHKFTAEVKKIKEKFNVNSSLP